MNYFLSAAYLLCLTTTATTVMASHDKNEVRTVPRGVICSQEIRICPGGRPRPRNSDCSWGSCGSSNSVNNKDSDDDDDEHYDHDHADHHHHKGEQWSNNIRKIVIKCTKEVRRCPNGSMRPRSKTCKWLPCPGTPIGRAINVINQSCGDGDKAAPRFCPDGTKRSRNALTCKWSPCKLKKVFQCASDVKTCEDGKVLKRKRSRFCRFPKCGPKPADKTAPSSTAANINKCPGEKHFKCKDGRTIVFRDPETCKFTACPHDDDDDAPQTNTDSDDSSCVDEESSAEASAKVNAADY